MISRRVVVAFVVLLALSVFAWSWWSERDPIVTPQQGVAKGQTIAAIQYAATIDTIYQRDTLRLIVPRTAYRTLRDTIRLTDSVAVRGALAVADTVITLDSVALASAARVIVAERLVTARVRDELTLAQQLARPPRVTTFAAALYDPMARVPLASVGAGIRLGGRLSLVVRGDQRFTPGDSPRGYVGLSLALTGR